jgi:NADH dehydrogenase FAD-containing subunit
MRAAAASSPAAPAPGADGARGARKRVVIVGFGDTGVLAALTLGARFELVAINPKPCLVSGQELGHRLAHTGEWSRDYLVNYRRYKSLDGLPLRIVHGAARGVNLADSSVDVELSDGSRVRERFDALLIASGVSNGFWRNAKIEDLGAVRASIADDARRVAHAKSVCVVGGGAASCSTAYNIKKRFPDKQVDFFFTRELPLPAYHPSVRRAIAQRLETAGVRLHPNHRAIVPAGFAMDRMTSEPVTFEVSAGEGGKASSSGSGSSKRVEHAAELTIWAVGKVTPNTSFLPAHMLTPDGFVKVDQFLRAGPAIFSVGDVADTDALRTSARNEAYKVVAHNIAALLSRGGEPSSGIGSNDSYGSSAGMVAYKAASHRWGSVLGMQPDGLEVFFNNGWRIRFPKWFCENVMLPVLKDWRIYGGIRGPTAETRFAEAGAS